MILLFHFDKISPFGNKRYHGLQFVNMKALGKFLNNFVQSSLNFLEIWMICMMEFLLSNQRQMSVDY